MGILSRLLDSFQYVREIKVASVTVTVELATARAEIDRLTTELRVSSAALTNANQAAADARIKQAEALERENRALEKLSTALMQTANFAAMEGGAKRPIYPGVGPEAPPPKPMPANVEKMQVGPIQGRVLARAQRRNFLSEYLQEQAEEVEAADGSVAAEI